MSGAAGTLNKGAIQNDLVRILKNMTSDWDTGYEGEIIADTHVIGDLGFESIDVVQLVVAIEEHYQRRDLPFERLLMEEGHYVDELTVGKIVDFLAENLNKPGTAGQG